MMNQRKATSPDQLAHRSVEITNRNIDEESRTVEIAFSSESVVDRYYGTEVLDHRAESVRLDRINNGGAFLMEHDRNDQIGVVERAWIDSDKKGRAVVKFSKSARAEEIFQDVKDGIRRLVSVGYRIHKEETSKLDGGREAVRAVDWEPYELSLVSIPADDSVGVGRAMESSTDKPNQKTMSENKTQEKTAPETAQKRSVEVINEAPKVDVKAERASAVTAERSRIDSITGIAEAAKTRGLVLDASKAVRDGMSAEDFQTEAFRKLTEKHTDYTPASDLSKGDKRDLDKFDLGKALRANLRGVALDGIERELVQEGEREAEKSGIGISRGLTLPGFYVKRDMTTTAAEGGHTVATNKAGLLDDFFNASIMRQLGATVLTGLTGNLDIPRLVQDTDPAKKAENAAADEVSPSTAQLSLSPKRLPAFVDISDQLMNQSSSAIESMIRGHLTSQLLSIQEAAFFHGGGTNEANGIAGTSGIGSVAGGTNGAAPTYAHMVALEEDVDAQNAMMGSLCYATNGQIRAKLKQTPKQASGVEGNFVIADNTPDVINGYKAAFTNAISRTLTKGTATSVCSAVFFGNFADYVVAYWGGLNLELLRDSTNAKSGLHTLVANTYYDGGVRRPKSFAAMLDALGA
jgi:HK97 family phage major capsid protein